MNQLRTLKLSFELMKSFRISSKLKFYRKQKVQEKNYFILSFIFFCFERGGVNGSNADSFNYLSLPLSLSLSLSLQTCVRLLLRVFFILIHFCLFLSQAKGVKFFPLSWTRSCKEIFSVNLRCAEIEVLFSK